MQLLQPWRTAGQNVSEISSELGLSRLMFFTPQVLTFADWSSSREGIRIYSINGADYTSSAEDRRQHSDYASTSSLDVLER